MTAGYYVCPRCGNTFPEANKKYLINGIHHCQECYEAVVLNELGYEVQ